ncbi:MAG: hypothetical protein AAFN93_01305 [Bacteroidota bacterium]
MKSTQDQYTILAYLDNALGRDTEIMIPVAYTLEKYCNCKVKFLFIWDVYAIRRLKPDAVLLPNIKGHNLYFEIAKYAYQNQVVVLAMESEGNFRTDGSFPYWGYNTDKFFYQEWITAWSERTKKYLLRFKEADNGRVVLTGGTGFDRYKICQFESRKDLLKRYKLEKYKKVIGYAGWAFGKMYSKHKDIALAHIHPDWDTRFKWSEKNRIIVREALRKLIESNKDTLFIFKRHPKESFEDDLTEGPNEMNELVDYDNVLYIRKEENIHNLIAISDLWLGFETTTSIEAWLLGKETILINPEVDFVRNNIYKGSLIVPDYTGLEKYVDEFYDKGKINDFYDISLIQNRRQIIADAIGFGDGLNHLRACYYFAKSLKKRDRQKKISRNLRHLRLYYLMHIGKYFYVESIFRHLPGFKKSIYVFKNMYLKGFYQRKKEYERDLDKFHDQNGITEKLKNSDWHSVIDNIDLS